MVSLPRVVKRSPLVIYVDAAMDAGKYRLGLFSMDVGSRSVVPAERPPNQQCAEAAALLWGLKLILNVRVREAHLFGDNAAALVQFLRCKAKVGRKFQQSVLKRFRYLWASCRASRFTCTGYVVPIIPLILLVDCVTTSMGIWVWRARW